MGLLLFIICTISATNIIVREYVFHWLRYLINRFFPHSMLNKLINCETCTGFWVGVALTLLFPYLGIEIGIHWLIGGLISSILNKTYALLLLKF